MRGLRHGFADPGRKWPAIVISAHHIRHHTGLLHLRPWRCVVRHAVQAAKQLSPAHSSTLAPDQVHAIVHARKNA